MKHRFLLGILILTVAGISAEDFGSAGAMNQDHFEIEEMMNYAIQDEYLALTEYRALMEEFGLTRPYSNIARAEETHIVHLEELYDELGIDIPEVDAHDHIVLPDSPLEAAEIGIQAEINNIAMYNKFLATDLPENVREVFTFLRDGSENHLRAFQRQVSQASEPSGRGRGRGRNRA